MKAMDLVFQNKVDRRQKVVLRWKFEFLVKIHFLILIESQLNILGGSSHDCCNSYLCPKQHFEWLILFKDLFLVTTDRNLWWINEFLKSALCRINSRLLILSGSGDQSALWVWIKQRVWWFQWKTWSSCRWLETLAGYLSWFVRLSRTLQIHMLIRQLLPNQRTSCTPQEETFPRCVEITII